ncbi:unnamed protein product [Cyprideis torosa]|uniref:Leucine-rich repeat-containing protein 57 n=1 Tax=Cyprideis torosa TaxID=163714 RepID=A0A7R8ZJT1_9CRUS|nr:unnamed protein product [Cyprideis torosa]CAG0880307.1 unnamed protein product [Cyprideis torosa]
MGNTSSGKIKDHVSTAGKTGALNLADRKLNSFPSDVLSVAGTIRSLDLSSNKLKSLPSFEKFQELKQLNLDRNRLESLGSLLPLPKLESVSVSENQITACPSFTSSLNLKEIHLPFNQIQTFPSLSHLPKLAVLNLKGNRIESIPDGVIGGLQAEEINLDNNKLCSISSEIATCPRLKTLRLQENVLSLSAIPRALLEESSVSLLTLEGNLFNSKDLEESPGYAKYMDRYTATKKKMA